MNFKPDDMLGAIPLVTVCVLSFNTGRFVEEAVNSILESGYPNLEFIFIDDGSTDGSQELLKREAIRTSGQLILKPENKGVVDSCNLGLSHATGDYFLMIGDDVVLPGRISTDVSTLENNLELAFTSSQVKLIDANGVHLGELKARWSGRRVGIIRSLGWRVWLTGSPVITPTMTWRTSNLRELGGWPEGYGIEDKPMNLRLAQIGSVGFARPDVTTLYRRHGSNLSLRFRVRQFEEDLRMLRDFSIRLPLWLAEAKILLDAHLLSVTGIASYAETGEALKIAGMGGRLSSTRSRIMGIAIRAAFNLLNPRKGR